MDYIQNELKMRMLNKASSFMNNSLINTAKTYKDKIAFVIFISSSDTKIKYIQLLTVSFCIPQGPICSKQPTTFKHNHNPCRNGTQ